MTEGNFVDYVKVNVRSGNGGKGSSHFKWGNDGSYSPNGSKMVIDKMDRWDVEWRGYKKIICLWL